MTAHDPASGDGWVQGEGDSRYWGLFGAAGLYLRDPAGRVLLQHRADWSHFGGTWGLPGGARHGGETAVAGALRESAEEAGVPADLVRVRFETVLDLGVWSYTTVAARATSAFQPVISDAESTALEWLTDPEIDALPLHPGFASSLPALRAAEARLPVLVVDAANVVGSRPDGWWRDRRGAAQRLLARLEAFAGTGCEPAAIGLTDAGPLARVRPEIVVVLEGAARGATVPSAEAGSALSSEGSPLVDVVEAPASGDDSVVAVVAEFAARGASALVVTADRELIGRVRELGASTLGPGALLALLDA